MRKFKIYQVDAFTDEPFGGNPAGVVPEAEGLTEEEMQKIAREMNLSETAFVFGLNDLGARTKALPLGEITGVEVGPALNSTEHIGGARASVRTMGAMAEPARQADLRVRFFTPQTEVDLCGHATIGTFFLLAAEGWIKPESSLRATDGVKEGPVGPEVFSQTAEGARAWTGDGPKKLEQGPARRESQDKIGTFADPTILYQETRAGLLPVEIYWRPSRPGTIDLQPSGNAVVNPAKIASPTRSPDEVPRPSRTGYPYEVDRVMMHQRRPEFLGRPDDIEELAGILGLAPEEITATGLPVEIVSTGLPDLLVPVVSRAALNRIKPDLNRLKVYCEARRIVSVHAFTLPGGYTETAKSADPETKIHAVCRDFAPAVGIPEESATGTASGALGAYLVARQAPVTEAASQATKTGTPRPATRFTMITKTATETTQIGSEPARQRVTHLSFSQGETLGRPGRIEVEVHWKRARKAGDQGRDNVVSQISEGCGPANLPEQEIWLVKVGGRAVKVIEGEVWLAGNGGCQEALLASREE